MTTTTITDRIRKLLALSESPNENEAALAAEKAQGLALKHSIDLATIAMDENDKVGVDDAEVSSEHFDPWRIKERHPQTTTMRSTEIGSHDAYRHGSRAGDSVNLGGSSIGRERGALPAGCGA